MSKSSMKVMQVVHGLPPDEIGGVELYAWNQIKALKDLDYTLSVFARSSRERDEFSIINDQQESVAIRRITRTSKTMGYKGYRSTEIDNAFSEFIGEISPDIVHIQHLFSLSTGIAHIVKASYIPLVISLHDYWYVCERIHLLRPDNSRCEGPDLGEACVQCCFGNEYGRLRFHEVFNTLQLADLYIADSEFEKRKYTEWGLSADKIYIIEPGVPVSATIRREMDFDKRPLRLGYVGSVIQDKGVDILIRAIGLLPDGLVTLRIFGEFGHDPQYYAYLRRLSFAADRNIEFMGSFELSGHDRVYEGIDLLVLPSLRYEGFGLVVREAWRRGISVVVSGGGALDEAVATGAAVSFTPGDPEDLARVVLSLLNEPGKLQGMASAIERLSLPTPTDTAARVAAVYEEAIKSRASIKRQLASRRRPVISVCIVGPNSWKYLSESLQALRSDLADVSSEVILVDNDSTDKTVDNVRHYFPEVLVVGNKENKIFSRAANQALSRASGDFLLLLGLEMVVLPGTIKACIEFMQQNQSAGAVGCFVLSHDGTEQASAGDFERPHQLFDSYGFTGLVRRRLYRQPEAPAGPERRLGVTPLEVDYVSPPTFLFMRAEIVKKIGVLDEAYLKNEYIDWCFRMRRYGYSVVLLPRITISQSPESPADSAAAVLAELWDDCVFLRKHYGLVGRVAATYLWVVGRLRHHFEREIAARRRVLLNYALGAPCVLAGLAFERAMIPLLRRRHEHLMA